MSRHHKCGKKYKSLGDYHVKDSRNNIVGYVYGVMCDGKTIQTLDAGGSHYAW